LWVNLWCLVLRFLDIDQVSTYDGDTPQDARACKHHTHSNETLYLALIEAIRDTASVLFTNIVCPLESTWEYSHCPFQDTIHASILPHEERWRRLTCLASSENTIANKTSQGF